MEIKDNKDTWIGPGYGDTYDLAVETLQLIDHVLRHPTRPAPPPREKEGHMIDSHSETHQTIYRDEKVVVYYVCSDYDPECEAYVVINLVNSKVYVHSFTPDFVFDGEKIWFIPSNHRYEHERGYMTSPVELLDDKIEAWGCDGHTGPDGEPYVSNPQIFQKYMREIDYIAEYLK